MKNLFLFILLICFSSCSKDDTDQAIYLEYDFSEGIEGWEFGFSDIPLNPQFETHLEFKIDSIPGMSKKGLKVQGNNGSDDLFLFIKRGFDGLKPNRTYKLDLSVSFASKYPKSSLGVGGSPGNSVFFKMGAVNIEPKAVEFTEDGEPFLRMNIDKGIQSTSGIDMSTFGTIGIDNSDGIYQTVSKTNADREIMVRTDSNGRAWVIFGLDSAFEGITTIYFELVNVRFYQKD